MKCNKCGKPITYNDNYCPKCGDQIIVICKTCGSKLKNEIYFCPKCGEPTPHHLNEDKVEDNEDLSDFDKKLKQKEIDRLVEVNTNYYENDDYDEEDLEPNFGILTDDEILKYSPYSETASEIKERRKKEKKRREIENAKNLKERIKVDEDLQMTLGLVIMIVFFTIGLPIVIIILKSFFE